MVDFLKFLFFAKDNKDISLWAKIFWWWTLFVLIYFITQGLIIASLIMSLPLLVCTGICAEISQDDV